MIKVVLFWQYDTKDAANRYFIGPLRVKLKHVKQLLHLFSSYLMQQSHFQCSPVPTRASPGGFDSGFCGWTQSRPAESLRLEPARQNKRSSKCCSFLLRLSISLPLYPFSFAAWPALSTPRILILSAGSEFH